MSIRCALAIALCAINLTVSNGARAEHLAGAFQLFTGPGDRVYRIDTTSGKTSVLEDGSFRELNESAMPQLVVGKVYRSEDGKATFHYLGEGKLEPWGLQHYFTPQGKGLK